MAGNEYGEAAELFQRALRTSEQIGDPYGKAVSLHNYAKLFFAIGQEERAWEAMDESLRLSKLYNMRFLNIQNYIVRGKALCDQADYAKAEGNFFRALTAFSKQGNRWGLCTVLLHICELHRLRGRIKEARAMLAEARRYADELDIHNLRVQCFVEDARLIRDESSEGQVPQESALRVLEQALGICEKCDNAELTGEVNYEIGETMVRLRRLREAPQFYRAAEEKFREVLENLPEAFRQSYSERQKSRFRDWKAPTTSAKSSDMEKLSAARADGSTESSGMITAEDSLRRVNQLMMLLCERGPLKSFLDLLIEDVLAVFRAEGAFLLAHTRRRLERRNGKVPARRQPARPRRHALPRPDRARAQPERPPPPGGRGR
jgi:tetratricopeptide (TPR) repeat protein